MDEGISRATSKLARDQVTRRRDEIKTTNVLEGTDLSVVEYEHLDEIRATICAQLALVDHRKWKKDGLRKLVNPDQLVLKGEDLKFPFMTVKIT